MVDHVDSTELRNEFTQKFVQEDLQTARKRRSRKQKKGVRRSLNDSQYTKSRKIETRKHHSDKKKPLESEDKYSEPSDRVKVIAEKYKSFGRKFWD